jgi:mono/diheme cytochrome c family protein
LRMPSGSDRRCGQPLRLACVFAAGAAVVALAAPERTGTAPSPTFSRDVAPILYRSCAECHRPGDIGPFSVLTYSDVRPWAKAIVEAVNLHSMPPWKPEPGFGKFRGERRLSTAEITTIRDWVAANAPEGDPRELPPAPRFPEDWTLGEPDMVLRMPQPFKVAARGPDVFQSFVIPIGIPSSKYVRGFEFRPGNRRVLHHSVAYLDRSGIARKRDLEDPEVGYRSFGGPGFTPSGALGGWSPGARAVMLPDGVAQLVRGGTDLVLQNHYHPSGHEETDQSSVALYFARTPPSRIAVSMPLLQQDLVIPPGNPHYSIEASLEAPIDLDIISVTPHMHFLGKEIKLAVTTPSGTEFPMIWIKHWSYFWHSQYFFERPLLAPRHSVIHMQAVFDNSRNNPLNPNDPPARIRWGSETNDEMALCFIQVAISRSSDLPALWRAVLEQPGLREKANPFAVAP